MATIDMRREDGGAAVPLSRGGSVLGPRLTQCGLGRGLLPHQVALARLRRQFRTPPVPNAPELRLLHATAPPVQSKYPFIHSAVWPQKTWAENLGLCPFRAPGSLFSTRSPGPRPTSVPSGTLIHQTVWRQ